jgi:hypothetical protein
MNSPLPVRSVRCGALLWLVVLSLFGVASAHAEDFDVTAASSESNYTINGTSGNPTLTLIRGRSYTFRIDACSCHPFRILGAPENAVSNNNTASGVITFNVPLTATNYTYICSFHFFGGAIQTIDSPPPSAIETWRQANFGTTANTGDAADLSDFDQDGLTNLLEFAFGLDPKSGSSRQIPAGQVQGGNFVVTFPQPAGVDGITYGAEWSETAGAGSWTPVTDTGTAGQHTFSIATAGHARLLVRLTVVRPPP